MGRHDISHDVGLCAIVEVFLYGQFRLQTQGYLSFRRTTIQLLVQIAADASLCRWNICRECYFPRIQEGKLFESKRGIFKFESTRFFPSMERLSH